MQEYKLTFFPTFPPSLLPPPLFRAVHLGVVFGAVRFHAVRFRAEKCLFELRASPGRPSVHSLGFRTSGVNEYTLDSHRLGKNPPKITLSANIHWTPQSGRKPTRNQPRSPRRRVYMWTPQSWFGLRLAVNSTSQSSDCAVSGASGRVWVCVVLCQLSKTCFHPGMYIGRKFSIQLVFVILTSRPVHIRRDLSLYTLDYAYIPGQS